MKPFLMPSLLALALLGGCDSATPNTHGNCQGLITVNVPAGTFNLNDPAVKYVEAVDIDPSGNRFTAPTMPPLPLPSIAIQALDKYKPGNHQITLVVADGKVEDASDTNVVSVLAVGRTNTNTVDVCPGVNVSPATPSTLDICLDSCGADLRCGKRTFQDYQGCQAECTRMVDVYAQQQQDWQMRYTTAGAAKLIGRLEACNFASCDQINPCGGAALSSVM